MPPKGHIKPKHIFYCLIYLLIDLFIYLLFYCFIYLLIYLFIVARKYKYVLTFCKQRDSDRLGQIFLRHLFLSCYVSSPEFDMVIAK